MLVTWLICCGIFVGLDLQTSYEISTTFQLPKGGFCVIDKVVLEMFPMFQRLDVLLREQMNVLSILDRGIVSLLVFQQLKDIFSLAFVPTGQVVKQFLQYYALIMF